MAEPSLPDKIVATDAALDHTSIAHAFGGALALAYYAEPRTTVDIDINVFVPPIELDRVIAALGTLGVDGTDRGSDVERDGQCRLWWGRTPLDLFFSYHPLHAAMRRDARRVPFDTTTIPILAPEHLVICKAVFDRRKDWLDIEQVLLSVADLRRTEMLEWTSSLAGQDDPRATRLRRLMDDLLGPA